MPAKSAKQYRLMQAAAHGNSSMGPSKEVAKEFIKKTPPAKRSLFAKKVQSVRVSGKQLLICFIIFSTLIVRTCSDEVEERNRCRNCELYREQLDVVIRERDKFLDIIVEKVRPRELIAEVETNRTS